MKTVVKMEIFLGSGSGVYMFTVTTIFRWIRCENDDYHGDESLALPVVLHEGGEQDPEGVGDPIQDHIAQKTR